MPVAMGRAMLVILLACNGQAYAQEALTNMKDRIAAIQHSDADLDSTALFNFGKKKAAPPPRKAPPPEKKGGFSFGNLFDDGIMPTGQDRAPTRGQRALDDEVASTGRKGGSGPSPLDKIASKWFGRAQPEFRQPLPVSLPQGQGMFVSPSIQRSNMLRGPMLDAEDTQTSSYSLFAVGLMAFFTGAGITYIVAAPRAQVRLNM